MSADSNDSAVLYHLSQAVESMRIEMRDMKLKLEEVRDSFIRFEAQKIETKLEALDERLSELEAAKDKVSGGLGLMGFVKDYGPTIGVLAMAAAMVIKGG